MVRRTGDPVPMHAGRDHWWHELMEGASPVCAAGAARQRASAVHPLHDRHDREAEGRRPHDRRLPPARGADVAVGVRPEGRRHLLVHRRRRLGDRTQLRRLRPARERRDHRDVRGRAQPPAAGSLLGDHRRATASPSSTPRRRRSAPSSSGARSGRGSHDLSIAAPARHGRRADQPRGLDVVPPRSSARSAARSSTPGGRPRPAGS